MTPNPFADTLHFLAKPAWTTAIYWLLLLGSIAVAVYAWRSIASQRSWRNVGDWVCRFFIGTMWLTKSACRGIAADWPSRVIQ